MARKPVLPGHRGRKGRSSELDVAVGRRLKDARLLAGATQEELGNAMGVSFQAVQKYESGENRLSVGRLQRAAIVLKQPLPFFFTEDKAIGVGTTLHPHEAEVLRLLRLVNEGIRERIVQVLRALVEAGE